MRNARLLLSAYADILLLLVLTGLSVVIHAAPLPPPSQNPLGYDSGFYRRYLTEPLVSFPNTPVPGLGTDALIPRLILDTLRLFPLSPDVILYGTYLAFFAVLPLLVFLLLKPRIGVAGAFFASLFIILSPIQFNAYWFMLWKNAWGLCLLFAAFICIDRKMWWPLIALDIALACSHKTTVIVYLTTLLVLFAFNKDLRRHALLHGALTSAILFAINAHELTKAIHIPPEAIFIEWPSFFAYSSPFLLLLACTWPPLWKMRIPPVLSGFVLACFLYPVLHIPFYERVFVFCDIGLAIFAGIAFAHALQRIHLSNIHFVPAVSLLGGLVGLGLLSGVLIDQIRTLPLLESHADLENIQMIGELVPHGATILTSSAEAPWFEGWTLSHIAAPGMLRDTHDLEEWKVFWSATTTDEKKRFLGEMPRPLYIATLDDFTALLGTTSIPCLRPISPNLLFDACESASR